MPSGIKMTLDEFIKKSKIKHNNKYSYELIKEYKGCRTKVPVLCHKHGVFWVLPYSHLQGRGCRLCANEENRNRLLYSTDEWVKKAIDVYGDKYDYSKVDMEHRNEDGKVCIICHQKDEFGDEHGEFWMEPKIHLYKNGCPKCGNRYHYTTEEWIEKAKKLHPFENYDYSKTEYINNSTKVCVICPEHGEFWRNPKTFLYVKTGCPRCSCRSTLEEKIDILLNSKNIRHEHGVTRKKFAWLENLRLDFYLPDYNVAIECQGQQHFEPVDFAGHGEKWAKECYRKNTERDKRKKELCENNGVKILYFAGKEFGYLTDIIVDENKLIEKIYSCKNYGE